MATAVVNPITQEILSSGFHHIAEEMAVVEYRASYSPIIREMLDFNCGLFTADGRMIANSEQIPAQLGLMQFALEFVLEKWGDDVGEGDAFLTNHPYMGGTHTTTGSVHSPVPGRADRRLGWVDRPPHRHRRPVPRHRKRAVHRAVPGRADLPGGETCRGGHPHPRAL